jgi:predicted nucleotidyltransferase component of viral defense system
MVTYHNNAITDSCHQSLVQLRDKNFIQDFYLAGGTALALQIGHRISTDLDWFSTTNPLLDLQRNQIKEALKSSENFETVSEQDGSLFCRLYDTDTSFINQHHLLLEPTVEYQGIELATPIDIGLMKLAAIASRGTRRDFIDIYCMRDNISLENLFDLVPKKYLDRPQFLTVSIRALAYFEDAEQQPMPRMLIPVTWEDVRIYCEDASRKLVRRLSGLS